MCESGVLQAVPPIKQQGERERESVCFFLYGKQINKREERNKGIKMQEWQEQRRKLRHAWTEKVVKMKAVS